MRKRRLSRYDPQYVPACDYLLAVRPHSLTVPELPIIAPSAWSCRAIVHVSTLELP